MRAVQVLQPTGPADVRVVDVDEPVPGPHDVLVEVHSVGVSFPDLLLSKGEYQLRPSPPFTLGVDVAGTVVSTGSTSEGVDVAGTVVSTGSTSEGSTSEGSTSEGSTSEGHDGGGSGLAPGTRVAGVVPYGGAGERAVIPAASVFALPDRLSYDEGASLPMNYLTALFALQERGQVRPGETVLVHGAAGGVGTATLQVAKGLGARTIGVVSTSAKADVARAAGADETVLVDGFKDAVKELTGGRGVDVVLDVVGGDAFTDSLRCLAELGRLLVVGFAAGQGIPEVKVNRLLLGNLDVRGVGWGGYAMTRPSYMHEQWDRLLPMIESGVVSPHVGATYELAEFGRALQDMEARRTLGKAVVHVR